MLVFDKAESPSNSVLNEPVVAFTSFGMKVNEKKAVVKQTIIFYI